MIDVGEGDSFLITVDTGVGPYHILIDGGVQSKGDHVVDFVNQYAGGELHAVIATHLDDDHIGGLINVVQKCEISWFYINIPSDLEEILEALKYEREYKNQKTDRVWDIIEKSFNTTEILLEELRLKNLTPLKFVQHDYLKIDNVTLYVLNPTIERLQDAWDEVTEEESYFNKIFKSANEETREILEKAGIKLAAPTTAINNSGIVIELLYNDSPYGLFTADVGADILKEVTEGQHYTFLKVPHHGSKTGLDEELVAQLQAKTAFLPVGENNHGHPAMEVLDLLRTYGTKTYCSQKTNDCRRDCPAGGFGNICLPVDKESRQGWSDVDTNKCINNR